MSIKKLFESTNKSRNYLSGGSQQNVFADIESAKNAIEIREKQTTFIPQIDYNEPKNFVKYGSANLYYKSAIERIVDFFPYDGSDAEINEFYNHSLDIEKYIFDNLYPRTNGYADISADGWGSSTNDIDESSGYGIPSTVEHITFNGGPNTVSSSTHAGLFEDPESSNRNFANIYDTDIYTDAGLPSNYGSGSRESNLKCDFDKGVTVEFWLKTGSAGTRELLTAETQKQVIFDLWNNNNEEEHDYGRIIIELTSAMAGPASTGSPFRLTVKSGSSAGFVQQSIGTNAIDVDSLASWHHYAFVIHNTSSQCDVRLYVDGQKNQLFTHGSTIGALPQKNTKGRIGALLTASVGGPTVSLDGAGKLSGSIDEFRFWKAARDGEEVLKNWFTHVRGGANTDISNTALGVYYKFNEGITLTSSIDSSVLDYGGRISNGNWVGYGSNSRSTGSAMVAATASGVTAEYKDPIIRAVHPDVVSLKDVLQKKGSNYDLNNNASIKSLIPSWIIEEADSNTEFVPTNDNNVEIVSHIVGTYFDKLRLLIQPVPKLRYLNYASSSYTPIPFAQHLPQSLGLYTPEIFIDADVLEKFLNRTTTTLFDSDLTETKNLIYQNLYNNLTNIYKSKGTEKAIRNVLRCFNVDDKIIRLNVYSDNQVYELKNNLRQTLVNKKMLNFNTSSNDSAVVYLASTSNVERRSYISGSDGIGLPAGNPYESKYGFTLEADITFPNFIDPIKPVNRQNTDISLFGMYSASIENPNITTWFANDNVSFQVYAIRDMAASKNVKFKLTSSLTPDSTTDNVPFPTLTSSVFYDVYDNQQWNFSVRLKPSNYPFANVVTGSGGYTYDLIFRGVNAEMGVVRNSFELTSSITKAIGQKFLRAAKRVYVGAHKTNVTGALSTSCDVLAGGVRYWLKYLDNSSLDQHAYDVDNYGISGSYQNTSPLDWNLKNSGSVLNSNTLALNWDFNKVHSSDADGAFTVTDVSSGSATLRDNYGWIGEVAGYQHAGSGSGWAASSQNVIHSQSTNAYQFINPEMAVSSDMIQILSDDDKYFGFMESPPNYYYVLEKSMHNAISEEILNFFAGVVDFNNVIGDPVNRYRDRYKVLEKLRESFFRRVKDIKKVEKFFEYYKWFDDALAEIIEQLLPATGDFTSDTYNTIESHVLERNKYWNKFPTFEFRNTNFIAAIDLVDDDSKSESKLDPKKVRNTTGADDLALPPETVPFPAGTELPTDVNLGWYETADPEEVPWISSGLDPVDRQRSTNNNAVFINPNEGDFVQDQSDAQGNSYQKNTKPTTTNFNMSVTYAQPRGGGQNSGRSPGVQKADLQFIYNALYPAGPVNTDDGVFVPLNTLVAFTDDIYDLDEATLNPRTAVANRKVRRVLKVNHGRDWEDGYGYANLKSTKAFPFNILSSSVNTGYNKLVVDKVGPGLEVVNLHIDTYGRGMEVPMQGPFTQYAVGGHQSRHIALNEGPTLDTHLTRPEAWKLLLGKSPGTTGAIGLAGADYPWPEANEPEENPYPVTGTQKAIYYRDFTAKRPVNIRNIQHKTGSTVLGNYNHNYEIVHAVDAYANPRHFVDYQPPLPTPIANLAAAVPSASTNVISFFPALRRTDESHFDWGTLAYAPVELTGSSKSIFVGRFSAPGGPDVMSRGFLDFRGSEYSAYNVLPYRNLSVRRPWQGPTGSISEATGSGVPGIRIYDHLGKDYGLAGLLARHSARFGRDPIFETNPLGEPYTQLPSFQKTNRNRFVVIKNSTTSGSQFDNAYVSHQIPRSDRQYSWFTASLISSNDLRYYRFDRTGPGFHFPHRLFSGSTGYVEYFEYITGSVIDTTAGAYQPTSRLNILTIDPVSSSTSNIIGYPAASANTAYFNSELIQTFTAADQDLVTGSAANYFNLLMARRGNTYGWNWKKFRQNDNPILVSESANNTIALTRIRGRSALNSYRLMPVSTKGRKAMLGISSPVAGMSNTIVEATDNNKKIFFNNVALDNYFDVSLSDITTPYDHMMTIATSPGYNLNAILYTQGIYPSYKNEFYSTTTTRTNYDNKFWRDGRTGTDSRDTVGGSFRNPFSRSVSQSCWVLDAQKDYLTRTKATMPSPSWATASIDDRPANSENGLFSSGAAGSLQNNCFFYFDVEGATGGPLVNKNQALAPGPLMGRKHMLTTPKSAQGPWKFAALNAAINSQWGAGEFNSSSITNLPEPYAGEAVWEAGTQAGRIVKSGSAVRFEATASQPWYNTYDDFRYELKLLARNYSIVPEFRISEHVEEIIDHELTDTFEIPGTTLNSSQDNFYKDYSNSEIVNVAHEKNSNSGLKAKQIRLIMSAAIRFNPYKEFFPPDRSVALCAQLSRSYGAGFVGRAHGAAIRSGDELLYTSGSLLRPLAQALFAPGIMYNSIKAGCAVDYPIFIDSRKFKAVPLTASGEKTDNWGILHHSGTNDLTSLEGYIGGPGADYRIPFEAIIEPESYIKNINFIDCEPHPSVSLAVTASFVGESDGIYSMMAKNYYGEVANFFLKNRSFSTLKGGWLPDDMRFEEDDYFFARGTMRRPYIGPRTYTYESSSIGNNNGFTKLGARAYSGSGGSALTMSGYYPLPQDPGKHPSFKPGFVMCSRPTSFGPPILGRPRWASNLPTIAQQGDSNGVMDCYNGYNWNYTPPYYYGEAWVDFIFKPTADTSYDIEKILAETEVRFLRVDPGGEIYPDDEARALFACIHAARTGSQDPGPFYGGANINANAMQISASWNLFGTERKLDDQGRPVAARWVLQSKFETPNLTFSDVGRHPISKANGTLTLPTYGSASVTRGMWHQFGTIPKEGVTFEIGDIPKNWMKYHPDVITKDTIYNDNNAGLNGKKMFKRMKSFTKLMGFDRSKKKTTIGEIASKQVIKEAIVAVPYITKNITESDATVLSGKRASSQKKFVSIPIERFKAAMAKDIEMEKPLDAAGTSIRKLVQKMQHYVLPPQFDFINNSDIDPIVMYIFEFKYELDRDDLSYIWQGLAPRNYQKLSFENYSISHDLTASELLDSSILENENLRWMVFKVKQRSTSDYYDKIIPQAGEAVPVGGVFDSPSANQGKAPPSSGPAGNEDLTEESTPEYEPKFNWPYDYISIVEMAKMDVQVLYKK